MIKIAAVIPARMGSTRFPGKPLLEVRGLPMVEHVRRRALLCRDFSEVVVATCDKEIASAVEHFGGRVIMTSERHPAATDRVAEAVQHLDCSHVVNVQGDEILVLPSDLARMTQAIHDQPVAPAWNAVARISHREELGDPSVVKCVVTKSRRVMYCARDLSSLPFKDSSFEPLRIILGILAYNRSFLESYPTLPRTPLETIGSIDQNRIIEHDLPLTAVDFSRGYPGINEPREVQLVERYLDEESVQQEVLSRILRS